MRKAIIFLLILAGLCVRGQSSFIESITIEQGLSQGFVPSITQDDDGFMWFATKNGLNRYDGYNFKTFRNDPFDPNSLNNDEVILVKALGDFLFLFTNTNKPMLFHRHTQQFFEISQLTEFNTGNMSVFDAAGKRAFISTHKYANSTELFSLSWTENTDSIFLTNKGIVDIDSILKIEYQPIPENLRFLSVSLDGKKLWLVSEKSLFAINIADGDTLNFDLPANQALNYAEKLSDIMMIFEFNKKTWIISMNGIFTLEDGSFRYFQYPEKVQPIFCFDSINGILWHASQKQVSGLDLTNENFTAQPFLKFEIDQLIRSVFSDQTGILWIGTDAFGVRKFNPRSSFFKNYLIGYSIGCRPLFNGEKYVLARGRMGKDYSLLINEENGDIKDISNILTDLSTSSNYPATMGRLFWWVQISEKNHKPVLICLNPETLQQTTYKMPDEANFHSCSLFADEDEHTLWIVSAKMLLAFDTKKHTFRTWEIDCESIDRPFVTERDHNGNFWLGTEEGLIQISPTSSGTWDCKKHTAEKGNPNSLPTNFIKSLHINPDDPDILWIGTNGKGLCRFNIPNNSFSVFSETNGTLPDDVVYGILADDEHPSNLWLSTNKGITRFNPESGFLQHFTRGNGLQENEFNTHAYFKASDGRLFFGGVNGLTVFDPRKLHIEENPPQLQITSISINGVSINPGNSAVPINQDVSYLDLLELPHYKNNLIVEFAIMDFSSPERNSFSYYLEDAENPWIHKGFDHSAQYLNLSPGKYTFQVEGTNSYGIKTKNTISLEILIRAPWYLTWPAFVIYGVLFLFIGFLFNQYQLKQRLKSAEARRLKHLDEFKSRFYTNITHEFRTPLTVILGVTDQMNSKEKDHSYPLSLIKRNAQNLLYLINQILDLTKLETHELKVHYIQGDILAFLKYISESLHSLANAQNVMLRVESDQASIFMDYDPERLRQIIHNLLSNAIKFTPSGGRVTLHARLIKKELEIAVADTGIGIPGEEQPFLFDRFFQAGSHGTEASRKFLEKAANLGGSGIGLSLTKELVQIMGGTIRVESPRPDGKSGTVFTVTLPVTNTATMENKTPQANAYMNRLPATGKDIQPETSLKILLVEDNPDVMEYLASCLSDKYHLEFAYNGRVGIEAALEHIPDLIISDVMMPEKDGLELCDFLKNDQRTSHIPIILLTAKATLQDRLAGLRRGADVYLDKPFHEEELMVWIDQLIARQKRLISRYDNLNIKQGTEINGSQPEALEMEDAFVRKFKKILEENYTNPEFSVDDITDKIGMSRAQLYRKLKTLTGKTVSAHLNSIRLEKSRELLKKGNLNISEVAYQIGYNDPKYFGRLFAETYGQTPSEFTGNS